MMEGVSLSVRLFVACLDNLTRERKGLYEAQNWQDGNPSHGVKRSKVKVTKPMNAATDNASYAGRGIRIFLKLACCILFDFDFLRFWLIMTLICDTCKNAANEYAKLSPSRPMMYRCT